MSAYRRKGEHTHSVKVWHYGRKAWVERTTGVQHGPTADRMQTMVDELGPRGRRDYGYDFMLAVGEKRLALPDLFDAWVRGAAAMERLRERLNDVDLAETLRPSADGGAPPFVKWLKGRAADTIAHYLSAVHSLVPEGERFPRSMLTRAELSEWQTDQLSQWAPGTVTKKRAGVSMWIRFLLERELVAANPLRDIRGPGAGEPRDKHLEPHEVVRLVERFGAGDRMRAFEALLNATGMDVSTALHVTRADFDLEHREVHARGTKTEFRDRWVRAADYLWTYVEPRVRSVLTPDARVFAGLEYRDARGAHRAACDALVKDGFAVYADYWMRDARHTFAVRLAKAGTPMQVIADQLGHKNTVMVNKVYARYRPSRSERAEHETRAAERDREQEERRKGGQREQQGGGR